MKPVFQTIKHDPASGAFGDCHRAAIATVLDLAIEDVPHFFSDGCSSETFEIRVASFLRTRGLTTANIPYDGGMDLHDILNTTGRLNGDDFVYLLGGVSRTGCNHTVVCRGTSIVHDPSPSNSGIIGPCDDGLYWLTFFCPLSIARPAVAYPQPHRMSA